MTQSQAFSFDIDADGIGLVTIDMPGRAMNVLNPTLVEPFAGLVQQLETDANLKGLVITSAKSTFIVGADIDQLTQITSAEEAYKLCEDLKGMLRRMEKCGKPAVAALNGTALGGGLELALPGPSHAVRGQFDALCVAAGVTPRLRAEVDDMAMLRLLAREGYFAPLEK